MSLADRKLVSWLKEMGEDITEAGAFATLKLFQSSAGQTDHIVTIELNDELRSNPEILGQRVWEIAEQEVATAYGMNQRFMVLAFRADQEEFERRFPFKMTKLRSMEEQLGGESVPPTETGVTAQLIRHDSENHRLIMLLSGTHAERMDAQNQRLHAELQAMQERQSRFIQLQEELMNQKADRELRQAVELQKAKQHDKVTSMVLTFMPLMFAKATGAGSVNSNPVSAHARDLAIGNFLRDLTSEELMRVAAGMDPNHQLALMEFYKSYRLDDKAAQADKPAKLRDEAPPEAN